MSITDNILKDGGATEAEYKAYLGGDDHENEETINDPIEDIDAVHINKMKKLAAETANRIRPGNLVTVSFELSITPGTGTTPIPRLGTDFTRWLGHRDGTIVGIFAQFKSNVTAGDVTIQPKINGSDCAINLVIPIGVPAAISRQVPGDGDPSDIFDASALQYVELDAITDGATWSGDSKLLVDVFVSIGEEEAI